MGHHSTAVAGERFSLHISFSEEGLAILQQFTWSYSCSKHSIEDFWLDVLFHYLYVEYIQFPEKCKEILVERAKSLS